MYIYIYLFISAFICLFIYLYLSHFLSSTRIHTECSDEGVKQELLLLNYDVFYVRTW